MIRVGLSYIAEVRVPRTRGVAPPVLVLNAQRHDGVDYIVVIFLQCFNSLLARNVGLGHDELNILVLDTLSIYLFAVILLFFLGCLALVVMVIIAVAVTGVVVVVSTSAGKLLGSSGLGTGVEVLNLSLAKDTTKQG